MSEESVSVAHKKLRDFSSKDEERFYAYLLTIFKFNDIERQYDDDIRYPFACDFYVKSVDLFIECNFHWTHNGHWYDSNNEHDNYIVNLWKSKHKKYYDTAISVWTIHDLKKYEYGKKLNYIVLWNSNTMIKDFKKSFYKE